jgi:streptogramin lyase
MRNVALQYLFLGMCLLSSSVTAQDSKVSSRTKGVETSFQTSTQFLVNPEADFMPSSQGIAEPVSTHISLSATTMHAATPAVQARLDDLSASSTGHATSRVNVHEAPANSFTTSVPGIHAVNNSVCSVIYTTDADFDLGNLQNVNHDSPNNDQLQLNDRVTPPPFIWIALSGRGTAARLDVATGAILGEYYTAPDGRFRDPSRTTVDFFGNVWVGNRAEAAGNAGSVVKIAIVVGGTRCDSDGSPNPIGLYLKPPFIYSTAVDRDNDGLIKTSRGSGDIRPWTNAGGADNNGGVSTADDECITIYQRTPGTPNVRHLSMDADNNVWVGGYNFGGIFPFHKLDGNTGAILTTRGPLCGGGYGGLIDGAGILWSADVSYNRLTRYDPVANSSTCLAFGTSYGLGIDGFGNIWNTSYNGNVIRKYSPAGAVLGTFPTGGAQPSGVAVTSDNDVWVPNRNSNTLVRLSNAGAIKKLIPVGSTPTGVAVDANDKVWVTNYGSHNAMRIDPAAGGDGLGAVDLTVPLGASAFPYNYSDMTGAVAIGATSQQGTWTVVHNSGVVGTKWGSVSWNGSTPAGTAIKVEVRSAASQAGLSLVPFVQVGSGNDLCDAGFSGQYVEIRTTLSREPNITDTPILYDLTLSECDEDAPVPDVATLPDVTGECSAEVTTVPTATDRCEGTIYGTTTDPLVYTAQGSYVVTWSFTDAEGNTSTQTQNVIVDDVTPPTIMLAANPVRLWMPNHTYQSFSIEQMVASVSDNCDDTPGLTSSLRITQVTSDEAEDAHDGDGATLNDILIVLDCQSVQVRKERVGGGNGRVYSVTVAATDYAGNTSTSVFKIHVPVSINSIVTEDAPQYLVTSGCASSKSGPVSISRPSSVELEANYPNPFNPSTTIAWNLPEAMQVQLTIHDALGREVAKLLDENFAAGRHTTLWDSGNSPAGSYMARLVVRSANGSESVHTRMMLLLK